MDAASTTVGPPPSLEALRAQMKEIARLGTCGTQPGAAAAAALLYDSSQSAASSRRYKSGSAGGYAFERSLPQPRVSQCSAPACLEAGGATVGALPANHPRRMCCAGAARQPSARYDDCCDDYLDGACMDEVLDDQNGGGPGRAASARGSQVGRRGWAAGTARVGVGVWVGRGGRCAALKAASPHWDVPDSTRG
jgi:hypothetical protein